MNAAVTFAGYAVDDAIGFHVVQISDTHLSRQKPFFVGNFHRVVESLEADAPDLVINTGDIALDGVEPEDDLAAAPAGRAAAWRACIDSPC